MLKSFIRIKSLVFFHLCLKLLEIGFKVLGLIIEVLDVLKALRGVLVQAREHDGLLTDVQEVHGVVHLGQWDGWMDRTTIVKSGSLLSQVSPLPSESLFPAVWLSSGC